MTHPHFFSSPFSSTSDPEKNYVFINSSIQLVQRVETPLMEKSQRPSGRFQVFSGRCEMLSARCDILSGRCEMLSGRCEILSGSQDPGIFPSLENTF